jgi:hypothetical protein
MSFPFKSYDFAALSLQDLLAARELYHLHLMDKRNVVATALGYYRIRKVDKWPTPGDPNPDTSKNKIIERTLGNSEVRPYSWPAILVFVEKWENDKELLGKNGSEIVPKTLYLPDGKAIPVCVIKAEKIGESNDIIDFSSINFPRNVISGGFPLITEVQNEKKIASFGCLVTDGHLTYALTNKHVVGKAGTPIKTILNDEEVIVGKASELQMGRIPFEKVYPTFKGSSLYLNMDVGLIDINDINQWKTEVYGIGQLEKMVDLDTNNITLKLINQKVVGFGGVSGKVFEGEIQALFYRYKSVGGFEYVSDFLIGPRTKNIPHKRGDENKYLSVKRGDSGSLILLELDKDDNADSSVTETKYYPLGVLWGMHEFAEDGVNHCQPYILASCLSSICSLLDVELVRNWNLDLVNTWGKTGHFKVGAKACELVSNNKLYKLLKANQENIGYADQDMIDGNTVGGKFTKEFVPLADVADIIWRTTRPSDESNHFCDIDETNKKVMNGKSLLQLCIEDENNIDLDVWLDFDTQMDEEDPVFHINKKNGKEELRPRRGALPFRVWQMYNQMIKSLQESDLIGFIVAGGTMSHYVGDACQPLHISYLHHGHPGENETAVHSDYETTMIDKKMDLLFIGVEKEAKKVKVKDLIDASGKSAAKRVLELMQDTVELLPPQEVVECWAASAGRGKWDKMWGQLGERTVNNIAEGARVLAILWQSAWVNGDGDAKFKINELVELDQKNLQKKYMDKSFVPSYVLGDDRFKNVCY